MTATLNEVVKFLLGSGELEGVYFGEIPEGERSQNWWRKHLRIAYEATQETDYLALKRIRNAVAEHYQIAPEAMTREGRAKSIVLARQMAYLLCRSLTPYSTTEIGAAFSRDHSTIVVGLETMRRRVNQDPELRAQYEALKQKLETRTEQ